MNEISSTAFRKEYARLAERTVVTVNGHPIGTWIPTTLNQELTAISLTPQAQRDALLRKINRSK